MLFSRKCCARFPKVLCEKSCLFDPISLKCCAQILEVLCCWSGSVVFDFPKCCAKNNALWPKFPKVLCSNPWSVVRFVQKFCARIPKFRARNRVFSGARLLLKIVFFRLLQLTKNAKSEIQEFFLAGTLFCSCYFFQIPRTLVASRGFWVSQSWQVEQPEK